MDGLSAAWVFGIPIGFVLGALALYFPILFVQKKLGHYQRWLSLFIALIGFATLSLYFLYVFKFFGFYAGLLTYVPLLVLALFSGYFLFRSIKPADLSNYKVPLVYKAYVGILAAVVAWGFYLYYFPDPDKKFTSPDGKYYVYAYTGDSFGKTRFQLYSADNKFIGVGVNFSGGTPIREGGAFWHEDHVTLDYMCMGGDCYPAHIRLDGKPTTMDDEIAFDELYKKSLETRRESSE